MIVVTGATGKLGTLVVQELIKKVPANQIVAAVRNPAKAQNLKALGVVVRQADYDKAEGWDAALAGAQKVLLISSSEVGKRARQHRTVIEAAKKAGVKFLAYTSLLHADTTPLSLAAEHIVTEKEIRESGIPYVVLRNGWYLENHTENLAAALEHGVILGAAGEGRIAAASRADFAAACAAVLTSDGHAGKIYELAGDDAYTMAELANEVSRHSGKPVKYQDMPEEEYKKALVGFGLPEPLAHMLANSDAGVKKGALNRDSKDFRALIGRQTTRLADAVKRAVQPAGV